MSEKPVTNLSAFNADAVLTRLMINPRFEPIEAAAARFVFDTHVLESDIPRGTGRRKAEVENTINFMQERLDCLVHHSEDFFEGEAFDKEALILAALCGTHLHTANEEEAATINLSFDPKAEDEDNMLARARALLGESNMLAVAACEADIEEASREAVFLAHIEALIHTIPSLKQALDAVRYDVDYGDDLRAFIEDDCLAIGLFVALETELGQKLNNIAGNAYCQTLKALEVLPIGENADLAQNDNFGQP